MIAELYDYARELARRAVARLMGAKVRLHTTRDALVGLLRPLAHEASRLAFGQAHSYDRGRRVEKALQTHIALQSTKAAHKLGVVLASGSLEAALARAHLIADTELSNLSGLATVGAFGSAGHTLFRIDPVLDERTTATCHAARSLVLDMAHPLHRHLCPACHFGCRSVLVPATGAPSLTVDVERVLRIRSAEFPTFTPRLTHLLGMVTP